MKISYNWLKELIELDLAPEKISEILTGTGLEVEGIEPFNSIKGGLTGVVVGEVITCQPHPNADKLKCTTVNVGKEDLLSIVCGASNVAAGQKVLVATIGTTIYPAQGEPFEIKKSKIRGEVSEGMICAEDELGLGNSHEGILVLPAEVKPGTPASSIFEVYTDQLIEIGLTANRGDAASHLGVARDLRAVTNANIKKSNYTITSSADKQYHINIETNACIRYTGIELSNVKVAASPQWLQNKLKVIGINAINNVVDITNYVMHELGQPLHAFDATSFANHKITVKEAQAGAKFTTLDKVERTLFGHECMICNETNYLAIGGVFGGLDSGISNDTQTIFIESATFDAGSVRKTAKSHQLSTDASFRFERGTDPNQTIAAINRAVQLLETITGATVSSKLVDVYPNPVKEVSINFRLNKFYSLIGQTIAIDEVQRILKALDFEIVKTETDCLTLSVPTYRTEVTREADVAEELLRIYGLNNIHIPERVTSAITNSSENSQWALRNKISDMLTGYGFNEILNNSITKSAYYPTENAENRVAILNPLSSDLDSMRSSMLFGGLEVIQYNKNRKASNVSLFEFGKTYTQENGTFKEQNHLAIFACGKQQNENWHKTAEPFDYFYTKSIVQNLLRKAGITKADWLNTTTDGSLKKHTTVTVNKQIIATFGSVQPAMCKPFDITDEVWYVDINWDVFCQAATSKSFKLQPVPAFPSVKRDLALLIDQHIKYAEIEKLARKTEQNLLKEVNVFDVYVGDKISAGKKSYAVSFTLQHADKTLTDFEIEDVMNRLLKAFEKELGATLRQ